uniref:Thaumatin-like protein n=1 Tax=Oryza brachyantha TaxID=4533 RepID=J3MH31_ORYBR
MAMAVRVAAGLVVALLLAGDASAATLALYNRCVETVWPGIQPSAGKELLARGGFQLAPNRATSIRLPAGCACAAYGAPQYCCTGQFGSPQQCKPTAYSRLFKTACPKAYSYAYDDPTSILTCSAGASYIVTFCPHRR